LAEAKRRCLGCNNMFKSSGASNRFCKTCKKKRKKLSGSFSSLDTSQMPSTLSTVLSTRYFEQHKSSRVVYKSKTDPPPKYNTIPRKPIPKPKTQGSQTNHSEWGPPYPEEM
jgi:hypothetical protein